MQKYIKLSLIIILFPILILTIACAIFVHIMDVEDYKKFIQEHVQQQTGHRLVIRGDVKLTYFPRLGVQLHDVVLQNNPLFKERTLAQAASAHINIETLPLFTGKIRVGDISAEQFNLYLLKTNTGKQNWSTLARKLQLARRQSKTSSPGQPLQIAGIQIHDAAIHYKDQQSQHHYKLEHINFNASGINTAGDTFDIELGFHLNKRNETASTPIALKVSTEINYNSLTDTIQFSDMNLSTAAVNVKLNLHGKSLTQQPEFKGYVKVNDLNLPMLAEQLGLRMPGLNSSILNNTESSFDLRADAQSIQLSKLRLTHDNTKVTGDIIYQFNKQKPSLLNLEIDELNLDRYINWSAKTENQLPSEKDRAAQTFLKSLYINGNVNVKHLTVKHLVFEQAKFPFFAHAGIIKLGDFTSNFYNGKITSLVTLDVKQTPAVSTTITKISNAQVQPLLVALANSDELSGALNMQSKVKALGLNSAQLKRTAKGSVKFSVTDGYLTKTNIIQLMQVAIASMNDRQTKATGNGQTKFTTLTGTLNLENGVATNNDLLLRHPLLRIAGEGKINLLTTQVYYHANAKASNITITVPILILGELAHPKISIDIPQLIKNELKQKMQQEIGISEDREIDDESDTFNRFIKKQFIKILK